MEVEVEVVIEDDLVEGGVKVVSVVTVAEKTGEEEKVAPGMVASAVTLARVEEDKDPHWGEKLPLLLKSV